MLLQSLLTKLGAAGLAAKAAAGGTAVVVAASAAGAADALPEPAQDAFERITAEVVVEAEDEGAGEGEGPAEGSFGARVSQDATGEDGSEPGVDGCEIAREASGRALEDCGSDTDDTDVADADDEGEGPPEGSFGARVSQDATGEDGSEPGVDGREIAEEAKANGNGADDTDHTDDDGGPAGTPGEGAVNNFRPDDEG